MCIYEKIRAHNILWSLFSLVYKENSKDVFFEMMKELKNNINYIFLIRSPLQNKVSFVQLMLS